MAGAGYGEGEVLVAAVAAMAVVLVAAAGKGSEESGTAAQFPPRAPCPAELATLAWVESERGVGGRRQRWWRQGQRGRGVLEPPPARA